MHTSLATAILDQIKLRKLDLFFELEEKILSKQNLDKSLKEVSKNIYRVSHLFAHKFEFPYKKCSYLFTPAFPKAWTIFTLIKVEKILKGVLDLIPSPSPSVNFWWVSLLEV